MILEKSMVFNESAINIFVDSSVFKNKDGTYISSPSYTVLDKNGNRCNFTSILLNSTNNQGEIFAIYEAIRYITNIPNHKNYIFNIFSDSKISVYGLRDWIKSWISNSSGHMLITKSGTPVKNQEIFLKCLRLILEYEPNIGLCHVSGHMGSSDREISVFKNIFKEMNWGWEISDDMAQLLISYNNDIDKFSREVLYSYINDKVNFTRRTGYPVLNLQEMLVSPIFNKDIDTCTRRLFVPVRYNDTTKETDE